MEDQNEGQEEGEKAAPGNSGIYSLVSLESSNAIPPNLKKALKMILDTSHNLFTSVADGKREPTASDAKNTFAEKTEDDSDSPSSVRNAVAAAAASVSNADDQSLPERERRHQIEDDSLTEFIQSLQLKRRNRIIDALVNSRLDNITKKQEPAPKRLKSSSSEDTLNKAMKYLSNAFVTSAADKIYNLIAGSSTPSPLPSIVPSAVRIQHNAGNDSDQKRQAEQPASHFTFSFEKCFNYNEVARERDDVPESSHANNR